MISKKVEQAINDQIKKEEYSSRLYLSMASWCQKNGYPGAAAFLYKHSDEERLHELKLVHYLNDRQGYAVLKDIEQPPFEFESLHKVFEDILKHEEFITASINELYFVSTQEKDFTTANFLQWYITEQLEEENLVHGILDQMALAGNDKSGLFLIDKELGGMAAPTTGTASAT
jgi:ferritin